MAEGAYFLTRGLVLRETQTREADKILTVLTAEQGKIPVIARGARRRSCKFAACAQLLAYSELSLYRKGDWYYLHEGSSLELFSGLHRDLELLALASYFAELVETVALEGLFAGELLSLLLNACYALETLGRPPKLVKAAFELRLMQLCGYEPLVEGCAHCGAVQPAEALLDLRQGLLLCRSCAQGERGISMPLCEASLAALRHALYADAKRLYAFALGTEALGRLAHGAEAYVAAQLERGFRTLDYYKQVAVEDSRV